MLQIDWIPSAPLWFAGYLLVYNLDRLYPDPADRVNIPIRSSKTEEGSNRPGFPICGRASRLVVADEPMVAGVGTGFRCYRSAVSLSAGPRNRISTEGSSLCQILLTGRGHCRNFGRLSRHRWGFRYWDANNSGPVRTTEYDLFVDRVGGSLGWGERLAGNERTCESVTASGLSRRQCRIIFCLRKRP